MEKFHMTSLSDKPVHHAIPENVNNLHRNRKQDIFQSLPGENLKDLYIPFKSQFGINVSVSCVSEGQYAC